MTLFQVVAILLTLAALFSYVNYKYIRLPMTIGVMVLSLAVSLAVIGLALLGVPVRGPAEKLLGAINFEAVLLRGMLAFLLFAGALHIKFDDLRSQAGAVTVLSTAGVVVSTFIVGALTWLIVGWLHLRESYGLRPIDCMLFGALISPTDPIAVLGMLKTAATPKTLETKIAGESLFNDGFGVVVFLVLLQIKSGESATAGHVTLLLFEEVFGGILLGLVTGVVAFHFLRRVDHYQVEVPITIALAMGTYTLGDVLHTSGPIAVVVAGLITGNVGRRLAMSDQTQQHLDTFWELIDEVLNACLFVLIGLAVLVMPFSPRFILAGVLIIPVVLLARWASVAGAVAALRPFRQFKRGAVVIMTWSGLRGGISVALALSLPREPSRDVVLAVTYVVVIFSIVVQGLTVGMLVRRILGPTQSGAPIPGVTGGPGSLQ